MHVENIHGLCDINPSLISLSAHCILQVDGVSKTGKEFPVEVVVTSFVIEGEMFYTGIITETPVKGALTRNQSLSALSTEAEIREKHQKVQEPAYLFWVPFSQNSMHYLLFCLSRHNDH